MDWGAVNARARGIATHLLDRESLLLAAGADSWDAATRTLVDRGYPARAGEARLTPLEFDRVTGQVLAERLGMLARWLGPRGRALAILSEETEFRTLRRLLRGAAQGISPGARLREAIPTAGLSERVLDRLSRAESPARLAELLLRLGHPAGRALQSAGAALRGSALWRLEGALARLFAERSTRAARRAGPYAGSPPSWWTSSTPRHYCSGPSGARGSPPLRYSSPADWSSTRPASRKPLASSRKGSVRRWQTGSPAPRWARRSVRRLRPEASRRGHWGRSWRGRGRRDDGIRSVPGSCWR